MAFYLETGYLKIILGCMFSGKTTELFKEYRRYMSCGFKCMVINHELDTRYVNEKNQTSPHSKDIINTTNIGDRLFEYFKDETKIANYDVIFINEGQFFEDLYAFVDCVVNKHKKRVYVCGLDGDYQRKKFGSILDIIPMADDIIKLKAICKECKFKEAIFTHRLSCETEQTVIGSDNYISLCRKCYNLNNNKTKYL
mgnify:CR=1 FL=1